MSRNLKIEKINAYKKMIESKKLPTVKDDKGPRNPDDQSTYSIEEQIHMEFTAWAETQLADLLGESTPRQDLSQVFDNEQIEVLQQFADKMIVSAAAKAAPAPTQNRQKQETRTNTVGGYKPPSNAEPIGNRLRNNNQPKRPTTAQEKYLKDLEQLDRDYDPES
jgi:hypothetical protein